MTPAAYVRVAAAVGIVFGCGDIRTADPAGGTATTGTPASTGAVTPPEPESAGTTAEPGTTDEPEPETDGVKYDTPSDFDTEGTEGCEKVDFLFMIDSSNSMQSEQAALVASFPGFIGHIRDTLKAQDYHIMVVDSDDQWLGLCQEPCRQSGGCGLDPSYNCAGPAAQPCLATLGAGITHPRGYVGDTPANMECPVEGGNLYIVDGQTNLDSTFACIATVGTSGLGSETQMAALQAAVSPSLNGPGGCNEGFLRDDAILVATFISDEPDEFSPGSPQEWHDALVAAKGGDEDAVVVLGLFNDTDLDDFVCPDVYAPTPDFRSFVGLFTHGVAESVCEPDYSAFFLDAVTEIDIACDDFPAG